VVVKYGIITLISKTFDICDNADKMDEKCPLEKGVWSVSKRVDLPNQIPPGRYTVTIEAYMGDDTGEELTGMTGAVTFHV